MSLMEIMSGYHSKSEKSLASGAGFSKFPELLSRAPCELVPGQSISKTSLKSPWKS